MSNMLEKIMGVSDLKVSVRSRALVRQYRVMP